MTLRDATCLGQLIDAAFEVDIPVVIAVRYDPNIPLLPPFPHGEEVLNSVRPSLPNEGEAGRHRRELLGEYASIEAHSVRK